MALPFLITPMIIGDLSEIAVLEQRCFQSPWSMETYRDELQENRRGRYWVIRPAPGRPILPPILAYGGYWVLGDEAHIVTIATHPEWRRIGLGELLLLHLIRQAWEQAVTSITLEVRVSNEAAKQLYAGLGFMEVGRRKGYYPAAGSYPREDALLLTLDGLADEALRAQLVLRGRRLKRRVGQSLLLR